jgi:hypothetical protein
MCDAPNAPKATQQAPQYVPRAAQYVPQAPHVFPTPSPATPSAEVLVPVQHLHVATEITNQYRTLVRWQILGFLLVLDGPILLCFLWFTNLLPMVMAASVLFPVAVAIFPTAALIGLIHSVFRKPALRQKIAEMGVDSTKWATPLEAHLRAFWIATATFTGAIIALGVILALMGDKEKQAQRQYDQRSSPTLYEWDYQRRGVQ